METFGLNLQSALLSALALGVIWRLLKHFTAHPFDNIPGPPSPSSLTGNIKQLYNPTGWAFLHSLAGDYGRVVKYRGLFGRPQLYVSDPQALQHILVKDQDIYEEIDAYIHVNKLVLGEGPLSTLGEQHRKQRKLLTRVLSSRNLPGLAPSFYHVAYKLRDVILSSVADNPQEIDMAHWLTRTALEIMGRNGFGYSFDSLDNRPEHPYSRVIRNLIPAVVKLSVPRFLLPLTLGVGSPAARKRILQLVPSKTIQETINLVDLMEKTSNEVLQTALMQGDEPAAKNKVTDGENILSILLQANSEVPEEERLQPNEAIGTISTMMYAGVITTPGALARIFHLLAQHPNVQDKLRKEIAEARIEGGDLGYNELLALPYLDAIFRETLRLYPPLPYIDRVARQDTVLPLSEPITGLDGQAIREIRVPNGGTFTVAIAAANRDPGIWGSDAAEWVPDRWLPPRREGVSKVHLPGVYSNIMTFLGGGRGCLGFKFAELEMKVILSLLLESFDFSLSENEISWKLGTITSPSANGGLPQMPLMVSKI